MILFHNQNIDFKLKEKTILKKWITSVIQKQKKEVGDVNFIFCGDEYLLTVNKNYLNHHTYTDIITFDYTAEHPQQFISGDMMISIDRIEENAKKFDTSFHNELHRVMIHGVLHLLGFGDKTKAKKQEMTKQENACLKALEKLRA